jgi:Acetyltransferase (GNAT) domain
MPKISVCQDLELAERLWRRHWPRKCLFDLWPVRACFQDQYSRRPHFLVASQAGECRGLLALSWIEEENYYGHFPGEVWQGKTWLEQNKIVAADSRVARLLLDHAPEETRIRYLTSNDHQYTGAKIALDEVGYLFFPAQYDHGFEAYCQTFRGKTRKKMRAELERLKAHGVTYRYNQASDIERMFRLNLERYQNQSYFYDRRFLRAFENLAAWLEANGMLRITTVLVGGKVAAVDMGAVWNSTYTVMAGGTHADFPGIAKLINLHHLEWACTRKIGLVDFLCGEFNWKERFHMTTRPLYTIEKTGAMESWTQEAAYNRREVCAV